MSSGAVRLPPGSNPWSLPAYDLLEGLRCAEQDLAGWAGAEVLITGATGFLGSWLLSSLLVADEMLDLRMTITVLTRRSDPGPLWQTPRLRVLKGDVRTLHAGMIRPDLIVHAAADTVTGSGLSASTNLASSIVDGTARVLEIASGSGSRVLFLSSGAVYGDRPAAPASEEQPSVFTSLSSRNVYAAAKILAESLCSETAASGAADVVIARPFAFVGPRIPLDAHFAAGSFIGDVLQGRAITVAGDGRPVRSYLYAGDVPEWCWALAARGRSGQAYNVGSPDGLSIAQLAATVAGLVRPRPIVRILGRLTEGDPHRYVPDTSLARSELGLDPRTPLTKALESTIDWYRARMQ